MRWKPKFRKKFKGYRQLMGRELVEKTEPNLLLIMDEKV